MALSRHALWFLKNRSMLERIFGEERIRLDWPGLRYLQITQFPLPANWRQRHTPLLMVFDSPANIFLYGPDRFYICKGLRTIHDEVPTHYFEDGGFNDLSDKNWARYSFHLSYEWRPTSDVRNSNNIIDVLDSLHLSMIQAGDRE